MRNAASIITDQHGRGHASDLCGNFRVMTLPTDAFRETVGRKCDLNMYNNLLF